MAKDIGIKFHYMTVPKVLIDQKVVDADSALLYGYFFSATKYSFYKNQKDEFGYFVTLSSQSVLNWDKEKVNNKLNILIKEKLIVVRTGKKLFDNRRIYVQDFDKTPVALYYSRQNLESMRFYFVPYALFFSPTFVKMSTDMILLYTIYRDRLDLSIQNQWLDDNNQAYIIFKKEEVSSLLNWSIERVKSVKASLIKNNIISVKQPNKGKPDNIYPHSYEFLAEISGFKEMDTLPARTIGSNKGGLKPTPVISDINEGGLKPTPVISDTNEGGLKPTLEGSKTATNRGSKTDTEGGLKPPYYITEKTITEKTITDFIQSSSSLLARYMKNGSLNQNDDDYKLIFETVWALITKQKLKNPLIVNWFVNEQIGYDLVIERHKLMGSLNEIKEGSIAIWDFLTGYYMNKGVQTKRVIQMGYSREEANRLLSTLKYEKFVEILNNISRTNSEVNNMQSYSIRALLNTLEYDLRTKDQNFER